MEKIIASKRWKNAAAFIKTDENGNLFISAKWYDESGRGNFIGRTEPLGRIEDLPQIPDKVIKKVFINTFSNHLRKIFTPKKVKYIVKIVNQAEIDEAERELTKSLFPIWERGKKEYSWLDYPL